MAWEDSGCSLVVEGLPSVTEAPGSISNTTRAEREILKPVSDDLSLLNFHETGWVMLSSLPDLKEKLPFLIGGESKACLWPPFRSLVFMKEHTVWNISSTSVGKPSPINICIRQTF